MARLGCPIIGCKSKKAPGKRFCDRCDDRRRPRSRCEHPGCPNLAAQNATLCEQHRREHNDQGQPREAGSRCARDSGRGGGGKTRPVPGAAYCQRHLKQTIKQPDKGLKKTISQNSQEYLAHDDDDDDDECVRGGCHNPRTPGTTHCRQHLEAFVDEYYRRKNAGRCTNKGCENKSEPDSILCHHHIRTTTRSRLERDNTATCYRKRCENPSVWGYSRCEYHLAQNRRRLDIKKQADKDDWKKLVNTGGKKKLEGNVGKATV